MPVPNGVPSSSEQQATRAENDPTTPEGDDLLRSTLGPRESLCTSQSTIESGIETAKTRPFGDTDFPGLEILNEVGRGGMGVVYRARERISGRIVALKTFHSRQAELLYRFKQEFRALADLSHPNLVSLFELVGDGDRWCFTMEYLEGVSFLDYVRPSQFVEGVALDPAQLAKLQDAFLQLASGLAALHEAGRIHRDVKPGNVRVTPQGRVVLLDFGLQAELDERGLHASVDGYMLGTVNYMSPEQTLGKPVSAATDWYSVGIMLYQSLTGQLPFMGSMLDVMRDKCSRSASLPEELCREIPAEWSSLCARLLATSPGDRPTGAEVLGALRAGQSPPTPAFDERPARRVFVGRQAELAALRAAYQDHCAGAAVAVQLAGRSGIGKSALLRRFVDELKLEAKAVVVEGRCYEQESVPFKAVDSLIDALSRHLQQLPSNEARLLAPRYFSALRHVFPVFEQVAKVLAGALPEPHTPDPQELRRRAFASLRDLLSRIGDRNPLVLSIDDVQWGDRDSADLLAEILRPPDAPRLMFVASFREEDAGSSAFVKRLKENLAQHSTSIAQIFIQLAELSPDESTQLAASLLENAAGDPQLLARRIAAEAGGNTFFVHELARSVQPGAGLDSSPTQDRTFVLSQAVWQRASRLPEEARRVLEVIAVAGQPLSPAEVCRAANVSDREREVVASLRVNHFVRTFVRDDGQQLETYHDRVREAVVGALPPQVRRQHHLSLAETLSDNAETDPERLAFHWLQAGERARAGELYVSAAARAGSSVAFDRAARLYETAIELLEPTGQRELELRSKWAEALANGGRSCEAAQMYSRAAEMTLGVQARELRRQAAMNYFFGGDVSEGLAASQAVLESVGWRWPGSKTETIFQFLCERFRLWLRGSQFESRSQSQIDPQLLERIEICWSVGTGLALFDIMRGLIFQSRGLRLALDSGAERQMLRALSMDTLRLAIHGVHGIKQAQRQLDRVDRLAKDLLDPYLTGMSQMVRGVAGVMAGNWADSRRHLESAEPIFRDNCPTMNWELNTVQSFSLWNLYFLGEVAELSRRLPVLCDEATARGNLYSLGNHKCFGSYLVALAADDPASAQRETDDLLAQWGHVGFVQRLNATGSLVQIALYERRFVEATHIYYEISNPVYLAAMLYRVQIFRIFGIHLAARCALGMAVSTQDRTYIRRARAETKRLRRERAPWGDALAGAVQAAIHSLEGDRKQSVEILEQTVAAFGRIDMKLYEQACRRRLGQLLGGDKGDCLVAQADQWMSGQGVRNPAKMTAMLVPGFPVD